jgi:hypothetical protein
MLMFVALGVIEQPAAAQAEEAHHLQERKTAARLLGTGLGIGALIFRGVGESDGGAVEDFGVEVMPKRLGWRQELIGPRDPRLANALESLQGQAEAGLTVSAVVVIDTPAVLETKQGLGLADDLAAGTSGIEGLIKEAPEGAPEREDALAAVGALVGLREKPGGDELTEEIFELEEALLADTLDAATEGGQAGAPGREEGSP